MDTATSITRELQSKARHRSFLEETFIRLVREKPLGTAGGVIVLLMVLMAIFAAQLSPYSPYDTVSREGLVGPGAQFWFGTDNLGRDLLSRVIYGARSSLYVGLLAVAIGTTLATALGLVCGFFGKRLDIVIQRVVDAVMAFPWLILVLSIMAIIGPSLTNVAIVIGLLTTAGNSRIIRGAVMTVKENQYIEAARSIGAGNLRIILRHVLPNVAAPIIVIATLGLGSAILAESSLSFLGYGVPPPEPAWGSMLSGPGRTYMLRGPWMAIFPGIAISLAVYGFDMLGDALRDVLDPKLRGR